MRNSSSLGLFPRLELKINIWWPMPLSADTNQPYNGEIFMDKSHLHPNNPARHLYRYTSVPIEAASVPIEAASVLIEVA
jgi:hypothetical protein